MLELLYSSSFFRKCKSKNQRRAKCKGFLQAADARGNLLAMVVRLPTYSPILPFAFFLYLLNLVN